MEARRKPEIIFDGAFGTYIATRNIHHEFPEMANITDKEAVLGIHAEYIATGVNAIKTNTFAANPTLIPNESMLKDIIKSGCQIASQAVRNTDVKLFADIGPINLGNVRDTSDGYIKLSDMYIECKAENFLFETLYEVKSIKEVIRHIKDKIPHSVVIASFAVSQDGYTGMGGYYKYLLEEAASYGADYVGLNCICGPAHMLELIKGINTDAYKLIAMPNAGYPTGVNGRTVYYDNPDYFSEKLLDIYSCGVKAVGGCCGTTPEHIQRFIKKLEVESEATKRSVPATAKQPVTTIIRNDFQDTVIAVEIAAPLDLDLEFTLKAAKSAKEQGADFVTVPDSPLGKARANSLMISSLIQRQVGIKAIPHLCCRDKNQIAIKGDLIASNIEGITNILALTGDSIAKTDRDYKNVFGLNSLKLIEFIKSLNDTIFISEPYTICAALNINALNFDLELKRAESKLENGAACLFTQPILSERGISNYFKAKESLDCKIIAGILILAGYKNAMFLNNEVPGISIPEEIIKSLKDKAARDTKEISVGYTAGIINEIYAGCDGFYIMTPLKKIDFTKEIIRHIKHKHTGKV